MHKDCYSEVWIADLGTPASHFAAVARGRTKAGRQDCTGYTGTDLTRRSSQVAGRDPSWIWSAPALNCAGLNWLPNLHAKLEQASLAGAVSFAGMLESFDFRRASSFH